MPRHHKTIGGGEREWPEDYCVSHAEDSGCAADAEGQSGHGYRGKSRRPARGGERQIAAPTTCSPCSTLPSGGPEEPCDEFTALGRRELAVFSNREDVVGPAKRLAHGCTTSRTRRSRR